MSYPRGWSVVPQILVQRERWPGGSQTQGSPLVYPGQEVQPDQPVLRLGQDNRSGSGEPVAAYPSSSKHMHGVETIPAGLQGRVVDVTHRGGVVIESRVALVQGVAGAGNQVAGSITLWQPDGSGHGPAAIPPGAILVVPGPLNFALLHQAANSGVSGIIASSISLRDLEGFLRTDYIQLLNAPNVEQAQAQLPPVTLCLTEGFGSFAMSAAAINMVSRYQGAIGLLSGVTSVREGIFPELIISLSAEEAQNHWRPVEPDTTLATGSQVRVYAGERAGSIGTIDRFFVYEQTFSAGIRARAVRLRLEDGSFYVVPIALIERIG